MELKSDLLLKIYKEAKDKRIVINKNEYAKRLNMSRSHFYRLLQNPKEITNKIIDDAESILKCEKGKSLETNNVSLLNPVLEKNKDEKIKFLEKEVEYLKEINDLRKKIIEKNDHPPKNDLLLKRAK